MVQGYWTQTDLDKVDKKCYKKNKFILEII